MVGTFKNESSFIGIQTQGNIIVLKSAIPSTSDEQQAINQAMKLFSEHLLVCQSEEDVIAEVNQQLEKHKGRLALFVGFLLAKEAADQSTSDEKQKIQLFKIEPVLEGEQLERLLSK